MAGATLLRVSRRTSGWPVNRPRRLTDVSWLPPPPVKRSNSGCATESGSTVTKTTLRAWVERKMSRRWMNE